MSLTTCTIQVTPHTEKIIYASGSLLQSLGMSGARSIRLTLGSKSTTAPVKVLKRKGSLLQIPASMVSQLKLPHAGKCLATNRGSREIRLGPLIGILSVPGRTGSSPFGNATGLLRQIMSLGKDKSFYFAFTPRDVNWEEETITGYFPQGAGSWTRRTVPLPDVIYNRVMDRKAENSTAMHNFKDRFVRRGIPIFNWSFFDKWDVYKMLENDRANKYVPETNINPSAQEIKDMLTKHKFVYLKPTGGSLGIGIYRLTYNPQRGYFARFRRNGKNVLIRYPRFENLMNMLMKNHKGSLQNYVVQQGIRLIELDSCPIDFRFHMTKNGRNEWVVCAVGAKKAGRGSVTTHIRNGGQLMTPQQVLNIIFGSRANEVLNNAKKTAIELAEAIERNYAHTLGEIGFDLGIDQSENIWMFEANAKPGRSIFKHPTLKPLGRQALANLFEHSLYLSEFRPGREDK